MVSELEHQFDAILKMLGPDIETPINEHLFAKSMKRRWRFDRCWIDNKLAVEIEGGIYSGGRHVRGKGFEEDCKKYNSAVVLGWRVLKVTSGMMKKDPVGIINQIRSCLQIGH